MNPNIASPIQYGDNSADLQTPCEPADEIQKPPRNPAGTRRQLATELHTCAPHGAPLKHEMLHSTDYMVSYAVQTSQIKCHHMCGGMVSLLSTVTVNIVQPVLNVPYYAKNPKSIKGPLLNLFCKVN